jgi:hypothetical protein
VSFCLRLSLVGPGSGTVWRDANVVDGLADDLTGEHVVEVGGVLDGEVVGVGGGDDPRREPEQDAAVDVPGPELGAHVDGGPGGQPPRGAHGLGAARRHVRRRLPGAAVVRRRPARDGRHGRAARLLRAIILGRRRWRARPGAVGREAAVLRRRRRHRPDRLPVRRRHDELGGRGGRWRARPSGGERREVGRGRPKRDLGRGGGGEGSRRRPLDGGDGAVAWPGPGAIGGELRRRHCSPICLSAAAAC